MPQHNTPAIAAAIGAAAAAAAAAIAAAAAAAAAAAVLKCVQRSESPDGSGEVGVTLTGLFTILSISGTIVQVRGGCSSNIGSNNLDSHSFNSVSNNKGSQNAV
jgi:hypothetical protein